MKNMTLIVDIPAGISVVKNRFWIHKCNKIKITYYKNRFYCANWLKIKTKIV
jgi:hypothetical protein